MLTLSYQKGGLKPSKAGIIIISFHCATNCCQKPPDDQEGAIWAFHESIRTIAAVTEGDNVTTNTDSSDIGKFFLQNIANMDQTPLPFTFCDGPTYAEKGEKTIWVRGSALGLEKRQCTAQITLFADGVPRIKSMLIFKGKGKRISLAEKVRKFIYFCQLHRYNFNACMIIFRFSEDSLKIKSHKKSMCMYSRVTFT